MSNELYRAERCRDLAEEYRLIAAMCASTEMRDHSIVKLLTSTRSAGVAIAPAGRRRRGCRVGQLNGYELQRAEAEAGSLPR